MDQHFATRKCPFLGSSGRRVQLGQAAALYCRVSTADQTCSRQERDLRAFAKKAGYKVVGVWKETASGAKDDRAERKKVLALAQARNIDVILVTELTRWGRSARIAARSLTCFKFRFVSSPLYTFADLAGIFLQVECRAIGAREGRAGSCRYTALRNTANDLLQRGES